MWAFNIYTKKRFNFFFKIYTFFLCILFAIFKFNVQRLSKKKSKREIFTCRTGYRNVCIGARFNTLWGDLHSLDINGIAMTGYQKNTSS